MLQLTEMEITITPPHACPHEETIIIKRRFKCDNLKMNSNGEFECIVTRCPYDNTEYPQETIIIPM